MEKTTGRLIMRLTLIIYCFLLLTLLYEDFYGSNVVLFYQRTQQVSRWKLSSEVQESKPLSIIRNTEADETLQEHDPGHELQKLRPQIPGKSVVHETALQEHESKTLSQRSIVYNETIEEMDSRSESPGSRETKKETLQEHESWKEVNRSNREINETTIEVLEPKLEIFVSREIEETPQEHESRQVHQSSSRVSNETGILEEPKSNQLTESSSREVNETTVEQRAEKFSISKEVHGQNSGQLNLIYREDNQTTKEDNSRDSLFTRLMRGEDRTKLETTGFACHRAPQSVVCVTKEPVTIDTATMTVHIRVNQTMEPNHTVVRPYARQDDEDVLRNIRPVHFLHGNTTPPACEYRHDVPAVIFSSSGFTGNLFHEFNEIIIPLFITTYHFKSRVQFILMDYKPAFANKYKRVISRLSSYEVMDPAANPSVHCFAGAVAGLKWHYHLAVNSSDIPGGYTMDMFRQFLRQAYSLKIVSVSEIKRPKLILLARRGTRRIVNEAEMVRMMKDLGFEVIVATKPNRMSNLNKFARVVNSCSVLLGSHGAGLANEIFLPDGAVMVQIDLLGLEWGSAHFYGNPAEAMRVHYLRYKIEPEESTLVDIYGRNHTVITDPDSIFAQGYQAGRAVYLDQQNMKLNVVRLRETLVEALRLTGFSTPQKQ